MVRWIVYYVQSDSELDMNDSVRSLFISFPPSEIYTAHMEFFDEEKYSNSQEVMEYFDRRYSAHVETYLYAIRAERYTSYIRLCDKGGYLIYKT